MAIRLTLLCVAAAQLSVFSGSLSAAGNAQTLARHLPEGANSIAVVRVSEILKTRRAQREGWAKQAEHEFLSGAAVIPPWVDILVMGSLVRPAVPEDVWTAAILELPEGHTISEVARYEQSDVEELAGKPTVQGSRGEYLVALQPNMLGVMTPGVRQEAARWIRRFESDAWSPLSDYLRRGLVDPAHIVLSLDLQDMLSPKRAEALLAADDRLAEHEPQHDALSALFDDLKGITFTAQIEDQIEAKISIDFSEDVGRTAPLVKSVFLSVLADMGASLEEFERAEVKADRQSVVLTTRLSDDSLRRIMSLIVSPHPSGQTASKPPAAESETKPPEPGASPTSTSRVQPTQLEASRRYFRTIDRFISDLRRSSDNPQKYAKTAAWHERFVDRIENLSTRGVDPDLVDFAARTSRNLLALAASLRGQAVQVDAEQKTLVYNVDTQPVRDTGAIYGGWGPFGWGAAWGNNRTTLTPVRSGPAGAITTLVPVDQTRVNVTSNLREVRERQAAAVGAGSSDRQQIWTMIDDDRAAVLAEMRARYGDEFRVGR